MTVARILAFAALITALAILVAIAWVHAGSEALSRLQNADDEHTDWLGIGGPGDIFIDHEGVK